MAKCVKACLNYSYATDKSLMTYANKKFEMPTRFISSLIIKSKYWGWCLNIYSSRTKTFLKYNTVQKTAHRNSNNYTKKSKFLNSITLRWVITICRFLSRILKIPILSFAITSSSTQYNEAYFCHYSGFVWENSASVALRLTEVGKSILGVHFRVPFGMPVELKIGVTSQLIDLHHYRANAILNEG